MTLTFGKFKGLEVPEVLEIEPSYIVWATRMGLLKVPDEVLAQAIMAKYDEDCMAEAIFESEHGDWGDRE